MKSVKPIFFSWIMILAALACGGVGYDLSSPLPANTPEDMWTIPPSVIPRQGHTSTPPPAFLSPTASPSSFSAWIADFSDPILKAVEGQKPVFEDDFPEICIDEYQKWKICSTPERRTYYQANDSEEIPTSISDLPLATARPTLDLQPDLQNGYALLNKGWFYLVPESSRNPFYAHIDYGALILNLPEGKEKKDFWIYNPYLMHENFLLQFDLEFYETQPEDTFRFQFEQDGGESFALDLTKNKTWAFHWGARGAWQSRTGVHEDLSFELIRVLIIARDNRCAVYLNNTPLDYFETCRTDGNAKLFPQSASFHILAEPVHSAVMKIDNVMMWDLDQISNLP